MPEIKITCKGSGTLPLDQFNDFQGNLKTLGKDEAEKIKRSIIKHGFSFPVFVWRDTKTANILDGHQRLFVVRKMVSEGYTIGPVPFVEIEAANKTEAGEKLLMLNSHFAKMTDEGLHEFLIDCDIDLAGLADDLELPDIDLREFLRGEEQDSPSKKEKTLEGSEDLQYQILIFCSGESEQSEIMQYLEDKDIKCKPLIL